MDPARNFKKSLNMKKVVIAILVGYLGTISKKLGKRLGELEIRGRTKIVQTTALLRLTRIPRKVLNNLADLLSFKFQGKPQVTTGMENSLRRNINNNNNNDNNEEKGEVGGVRSLGWTFNSQILSVTNLNNDLKFYALKKLPNIFCSYLKLIFAANFSCTFLLCN